MPSSVLLARSLALRPLRKGLTFSVILVIGWDDVLFVFQTHISLSAILAILIVGSLGWMRLSMAEF